MTGHEAGTAPHAPEKKRRTSEETRRLILDAAGLAFATRPYREITLKDIAEDAGVSAPLIIKYFGSKEQLYDELVDFKAAAALLYDGPFATLAERMVAIFARQSARHKPLSMTLLFMSGASEENNRKLRENYSSQMIDGLVELMAGPDARMRAELVFSMLMGVAFMRRRMMQEKAAGSVDDVVALYAPLVQSLLDGTPALR